MKSFVYTVFLLLSWGILFAQNPGTLWQQYDSPEEAGWSSEKLREVEKLSNEVGSSAFMIIYDGKVVHAWGETERRFMCHSARKSLLTALYGFYVDAGKVDLDKTISELGIDDIHKLTDIEKKATIRQILQARSGVYHPAAYETEAMKRARPQRGSQAPGTFWYYNNWDFNTACHILMMHSGKDFFEDFKERIADPLQMEDFRLEDCYYHLEAEHSQYPAYPFRMSARDLGRIGQWYLQNGKWNGKQLISGAWVKESTTPYSEGTREEHIGYAYMWWVNYFGADRHNYSARGVGNQAIIVYPEENVVIVNRANTYRGDAVSSENLTRLTNMVFEARTGTPNPRPRLKNFETFLDQYAGKYSSEEDEIEVSIVDGEMIADTPSGKFHLIHLGGDHFQLEDAQLSIQFDRDEEGKLTGKIISLRD